MSEAFILLPVREKVAAGGGRMRVGPRLAPLCERTLSRLPPATTLSLNGRGAGDAP
jgi:hypothetical protein